MLMTDEEITNRIVDIRSELNNLGWISSAGELGYMLSSTKSNFIARFVFDLERNAQHHTDESHQSAGFLIEINPIGQPVTHRIKDDLTQSPKQIAAEVDKIVLLQAGIESKTYDLDSVINAMKGTQSPLAWWLDAEIDKPLRFGASQGWLTRLSTTQVGWSDAGFKVVTEYMQDQLQKKLECEAMDFGPNRDGFYGVIPGQNLPDDFMPQDDLKINSGMKEIARASGIGSFAIQVDASKKHPFRVIKTLEDPGTEIGSQWAKTPQEAYDMLPCIEVTHDVADDDSNGPFPL